MSTFSFHATKVYNTIEGGAICCKNEEQYEKLYNLKNFGIRSEEMVVAVGANAKMNEFQAAMGLCNLRHIQNEIDKREKVVELYSEILTGIKGIRLNQYKIGLKPNYSYFPVLFENKKRRDDIYETLKKEHIFTRKYFYPLTSDAACFKNKYRDIKLEVARNYSERILVLPLYADLQKTAVEKIAKILLHKVRID